MSTSVSSTASNSASIATKNRWLKRLVTLLASVILVFVVFLIIRIQGFVRGNEFSPTHFQQRSFSFFEIPLIHVQITPIKRTGTTPATAIYVRQNSLITGPTGKSPIWHLVSISRGIAGSTPADAKLLIDQLNLNSGGDQYWRKWSIDHPKQAKILWPVIQKLARRELYILMPQLFELAQVERSPEELQQNIDNLLRKQYHDLIQDMQAANRRRLARQLLSEATGDYPQDIDLKNLRLDPANHTPSESATPAE